MFSALFIPASVASVKITVLSGGVGGARFLRGLRAAASDASITAIVNTGDDMTLAGLRIAPDLDSIMYTLAGQNDEGRGWGRVGETERVSAELDAYGVGWPWFTLGDLDIGTHITRTSLLATMPLSAVTDRITARWDLGVHLIPMTDDRVETRVHTTDGQNLHFQEWWTRYRASLPAASFEQSDVAAASPAPGVLAALRDADVVLLAPSNPVVSIGTILGIPGIRAALAETAAPVVGVSPIIGGAVVRGMADACLTAIGVSTTALAVAEHYGSRTSGGVIDAWLVDEADAASVAPLTALGLRARAVPLYMRDAATSRQLALDALALA